MVQTHRVTVVEHCLVTPPPPPPGNAAEMVLPLTFMDMMMLKDTPIKSLYFYETLFSHTHFNQTIIPHLKNSLSLTLQYFLPLVGNLIIPSLDSPEKKPEIRYTDGDSVPLIFAESSFDDFDHLTSNHPKDCSLYYCLATDRAPPSTDESGATVTPLLTLQVTHFPEKGICVGVNAHHVATDGNSIYGFMKAWAYLSQLGQNATSMPSEYLPSYDRTAMNEFKELDDVLWNQINELRRKDNEDGTQVHHPPTDPDLVQATFVLSLDDISRLKNYVSSHQSSSSSPRLSTFTVISAYTWTCLLKSRNVRNNDDDFDDSDDEFELLAFSADCRGRSRPAIQLNYFGNCISLCRISVKYKQLMGKDGFLTANQLMAKAIFDRLHDEQGIFADAETWIPDAINLNFKRVVGISGSPRFDLYGLDFGWGKPKMVDIIRTSESGIILIGKSKKQGDVEVNLSFSKKRMENFTEIFLQDLKTM